MLTASEIRNVKFTKAMGGYKQEEVDVLLDRIEADYTQYDRALKEYKARLDAANKEIESLKASQNSIQNVLLSAQKLADQIVDEAKQKSAQIVSDAEKSIENITAKEKELSAAFEVKAAERRQALEKELAEKVKAAEIKVDSIKAAAQDSVSRQQMLYDRIKMEMSAFKSAISAKYKEHLELLKALPDTVPMDPKHMAEIISASLDKAPDAAEFIAAASPEQKAEESSAAPAAEKAQKNENAGFKVAENESGTDE